MGKDLETLRRPGPNSDRLYHGMVLVPGAIGELPANSLDRFARILIIKGHDFDVKGITEPRKQHLWLGYEDDGYGDNGYYSQDEGTQGQCKIGNSNLPHAFVIVTITHGAAPPPGNLAPFDISVNTVTPGNAPVDDNFIFLNPMWGRQITNHELPDTSQCNGGAPYASPCTTQPTEEDHGILCNYGTLGIVDGHHNWVAGTYEGTIFWNDKSSWIADGDYNFRLVRPDDAGMTTENKVKAGPDRKSMKLEFSSDETIDNFETPWWDRFHQAVDDSFGAANAMIVGPDGNAGAFGIVSGLIGLDCPHTCASEIHPVWAMAIQVKSDPADETWAVFVRRSGNEGFCSDHQHDLDDLFNDTFTFRLPWKPGATDVAMSSSTDFESRLGQATGGLAVARSQGVLLSFTMPLQTNPLFPRGDGQRRAASEVDDPAGRDAPAAVWRNDRGLHGRPRLASRRRGEGGRAGGPPGSAVRRDDSSAAADDLDEGAPASNRAPEDRAAPGRAPVDRESAHPHRPCPRTRRACGRPTPGRRRRISSGSTRSTPSLGPRSRAFPTPESL